MFIQISDTSKFFPVADKHPILLDAMSMEMVGGIEESVSPLLLRGFQLHTLYPAATGARFTKLPFLTSREISPLFL